MSTRELFVDIQKAIEMCNRGEWPPSEDEVEKDMPPEDVRGKKEVTKRGTPKKGKREPASQAAIISRKLSRQQRKA